MANSHVEITKKINIKTKEIMLWGVLAGGLTTLAEKHMVHCGALFAAVFLPSD